MDHGVTKRGELLTELPQFLPIGFTETFIHPLDRKTEMNRDLSETIRNIYKSICRISTQVNSKKLLFAASVPHICHQSLPGDRLVALNAYSLLPFTLKALLCGLFSLVHPGGRLERLRKGNNILINTMAMTRSRGK